MGLTNVVGACVLFGVLYGRFKSPYRIVPDRMGMCRSLPPVVSVEVGLWRVHVETWTRLSSFIILSVGGYQLYLAYQRYT